MAKGCDVFVLDMGQPVKIMDLARRMIALSGLTVLDEQNVDGDIQIKITGLRPGEKLYEELLIGSDPMPTSHPKIMMAAEVFTPWAILWPRLQELETVLDGKDVLSIRKIIMELVKDYQPNCEIVDLVLAESDSYLSAPLLID